MGDAEIERIFRSLDRIEARLAKLEELGRAEPLSVRHILAGMEEHHSLGEVGHL